MKTTFGIRKRRLRDAARLLCAVSACCLFLAQCDFPEDPPLLKPADVNPVNLIDSAHSLLPLKIGNTWSYVAVSRSEGIQSVQLAMTFEATYAGSRYFHVEYWFFHTPWNPTLAFPSILQASDRGLSFFERGNTTDGTGTRLPELAFTLPYPAEVGKVWRDEHSDFTVTVAAKDTTIESYDGLNQYRCYRYDVQRLHGPGAGRRMSIFSLPGSALFKITDGEVTFYTIEWSVG